MVGFDLDKISKKIKLRQFEEYPACALCGSENREDVLVAEGNPIVRCTECDLHYTCPRPKLDEWEWFLANSDTPRNKRVTDNRIRLGVSNETNASMMPSNWRNQLRKKSRAVLRRIEKIAEFDITRIHDVGCGVGFLIDDLRGMGKVVSGNDLNAYAVELMQNEFNLDVECCNISNLQIERGTIDAIIAKDYIEHTWHPLEDLRCMFDLLKKDGVLHIETFHIDCKKFDELGANWPMLTFNHVYHFSPKTLMALIEKAGFEIVVADYDYDRILIKIDAIKRA